MTLALEEGSKKTTSASNARGYVYRSFEAEEAGQNALKLGLREGKGLYHRHGQQGEPSALDEILLAGLLHRFYNDTIQECEEAG